MRTKEEILTDLPKNRKDWEKHYGYDNLEANLHGAMLEVAIDIRDILAEAFEERGFGGTAGVRLDDVIGATIQQGNKK